MALSTCLMSTKETVFAEKLDTLKKSEFKNAKDLDFNTPVDVPYAEGNRKPMYKVCGEDNQYMRVSVKSKGDLVNKKGKTELDIDVFDRETKHKFIEDYYISKDYLSPRIPLYNDHPLYIRLDTRFLTLNEQFKYEITLEVKVYEYNKYTTKYNTSYETAIPMKFGKTYSGTVAEEYANDGRFKDKDYYPLYACYVLKPKKNQTVQFSYTNDDSLNFAVFDCYEDEHVRYPYVKPGKKLKAI